jgi:DNA mismatch repair ATPase MutS
MYRLIPEPCPKSYGMNVARLANLPDDLVTRAEEVGKQVKIHKNWNFQANLAVLQIFS